MAQRTLHGVWFMLVYRVAFSFRLKMEAICSFETLISTGLHGVM
jgi:hypothetical protein